MAAYLPQGWPTGVRPPGSEDFEESAVARLPDVVPPDYRSYLMLRRYPAALASMARYHTHGCLEGARSAYRTTRTELAEAVPQHAVNGVLAT